jgi:hypothetical protein
MWRQRSRIEWLKKGDQNTKFFHRKASGRARKNRIAKLKRSDGSFETDEDEIIKRTQLFFETLYTEDPNVDPSVLLDVVLPVVSDEINDHTTVEFTNKEIGDALFQIGPHKVPGPDGIPARFV